MTSMALIESQLVAGSALQVARRVAVLSVLGLGLVGCGRPATEAECREILRRAAELELKTRLDGDPVLIETEVKAIETSLEEGIQKRCVGKRISSEAMECVRAAKSADEVVSKCLR
jgi:hypothetical protein